MQALTVAVGALFLCQKKERAGDSLFLAPATLKKGGAPTMQNTT